MHKYEYASVLGHQFRRSVGDWEPIPAKDGTFPCMNPGRKSLKILRDIATFFDEHPGIRQIKSSCLMEAIGCSAWQFNRAIVDPEAPFYITRPRWGMVAPAQKPEA